MERQLDLGSHRSRKLTRELVAEADLVLVMSPTHIEAVGRLGGVGKVHLLDEYAFGAESVEGIIDPFGGDLESYRIALDAIDRAVQAMFDRLSR